MTLEQITQPMPSPVCRAKHVASLPREISVHSVLIQAPQTASCTSQDRRANSKPHLLLNIVPTSDHLVRQPHSPSYSISWAGDQASNPILMFPTSGILHNPHPQSSKCCVTQNKPKKQNPPVQRHYQQTYLETQKS